MQNANQLEPDSGHCFGFGLNSASDFRNLIVLLLNYRFFCLMCRMLNEKEGVRKELVEAVVRLISLVSEKANAVVASEVVDSIATQIFFKNQFHNPYVFLHLRKAFQCECRRRFKECLVLLKSQLNR